MKTFFFVRDIFRKFPLLFVANLLLLCMANLIEAAAIFTIVPIVDLLIKPDLQGVSFLTRKAAEALSYFGVRVTLVNFAIIFLTFNVLGNGVQILLRHLMLKAKYLVGRDLVLGTFEDFFNARWYFFSSSRQGILLNTFLNEMVVVGNAFGTMALFFTYIAQLILYLTVPFCLSWQVTSISLVTALLFACPFLLFGKVSYKLGKLYTSTGNQVGSIIQESLGSAKVILGFGNQRKRVEMLGGAYDAHRYAALKAQTLIAAIPLMYYPLGLTVVIIAMFVGRKFAVPLSETAALLYSLLKAIPCIGQITTQKNALDNFIPSYEQVLNLRHSANQLKQKTGARIFTGFDKEIITENLSFAYPGHKPTLEEINVRIPKGKMVAFVGKSGGGKSTLIDMIMGFNEPMAGRITLDGIALQEFDIISYRRRIGYVPQESILFNMTIRDNLLWASESATDEEIKQACRQANADEFIEEFPNGYDTLVGDRGVRLSGGQIQRIALARAILRKPDILILDEATSSLDTHSERLIQQAIDVIAKQTTVIVIAHRLSTIVNADYLYVLKKGQVVEEGTYSELVQKNGEFHRMMQLQALEVVS